MRRLKALTLLAFALTFITLPFAAQAAPVAQAVVYYEDGSPTAYAMVFDGEELLSYAQLYINDTPMKSDGEGGYYLNLTGAKAGDTLVFRAEDANGNLIYTSSGVIPAEVSMTGSGQPTKAGAAYDIGWDGGSGAAVFGAGYSDLVNGAVYGDYLAPGTDFLTIPATIIYQGTAIFAASAMSGDTQFLNLTETELMKRSYFLIDRDAWTETTLQGARDVSGGQCNKRLAADSGDVVPGLTASSTLKLEYCRALCLLHYSVGRARRVWTSRAASEGWKCFPPKRYCITHCYHCAPKVFKPGCVPKVLPGCFK